MEAPRPPQYARALARDPGAGSRLLPPGRLGGVFAVVMGALFLLGCASDAPPAPLQPAFDLYHPSASTRIEAITAVEQSNAREHLPDLVRLLDDREPAVRMLAHDALERMTGRQAEFPAFAPPAQRAAAVQGWRDWLASAQPAPIGPGTGATAAGGVIR